MRSTVIIESILTKVKAILQNHADQLNQNLTAENAENVTRTIKMAVTEAAADGFKTYIELNEVRENSLIIGGKKYQFNRVSNKEYQCIFGSVTMTRRLYQNEDGESFVPLDHAWNMADQFATIEVREAVLFAQAILTAREARQVFEKCSAFHLAESSFKKIAAKMGPVLENNIDAWMETIRQQEVIPTGATKVIAVSQDGTNVLLQEPGKKKGRKRQRPGERKRATESVLESPTSYKNAFVGSVTLYGDVPPDDKAPLRLQSRYHARMPEDRALTLKSQLEKEVSSTLDRLDETVAKIFISDAAKGILKEADTNPLYAGFETIIDYFHTTEHLSNAAEAIFGKNSPEGDRWYESKRLLLLESRDGANDVYRSLLYYQKNYEYQKDRRESLAGEITFFRNNKSRMEYKRFRDNGWPIGSGVIEAACKSLVKCRLCRSGMRWTRPGGQAILTLRVLVKSDRWESFWNLYKTASFIQNTKTAT
jgi:hypothetical protein